MSATLDRPGRTRAPVLAPPAGQAVQTAPGHTRRPYLIIGLGSLLVGALSLLSASAPSYDPWAWIIWGREVSHLSLVTIGGPTWKPLPVLFTTAFAPFGSAAPDLWLLVARAGGAFGLAMCALLAFRLTRERGRTVALGAGALAATGVLMMSGYFDSVASGESEGLLVALVALAWLRHLDGSSRQALGLWFAAALIRPEVWPFLALYAGFVWRRDPGARWLVAALLALVPVLWFLPEAWGAHSLLRGASWARHPRPGSAALASCPFCSELGGHAWPLLLTPFKLGVAFIVGLLGRDRLRRPPAAPALLAVAWIVEEALFTQAGFSGSDRYLIAPVAILIVVGSAGWGSALSAVRRWRALIALVLAGFALGVADAASLANLGETLTRQRVSAQLGSELAEAVVRAGGSRALLACGPIQTNPSEVPLTAWTLNTQMLSTESGDGNVVIRSRSASSPVLAPAAPRRGDRLLARSGGVSIYGLPGCS